MTIYSSPLLLKVFIDFFFLSTTHTVKPTIIKKTVTIDYSYKEN